MSRQSTNHIMMIEPAEFYANPETMSTNAYQVEQDKTESEILSAALEEFHAYRKTLEGAGVKVTVAQGLKGCPDMIFPNWASTHEDGRLILYPMLNKNRQAERDPAIIEQLKADYPNVTDLTHYEEQGLCLEAQGSLVLDRVNKTAYAALSPRTSKELAEKWADMMGYKLITFETKSHSAEPVYHTDLVIYIGTTMIFKSLGKFPMGMMLFC